MNENNLESVVLGGGCFWCLEAVYDQLRGVNDVVSGYAGGDVPSPGYRDVCTGRTGHAEVIKVVFDPGVITLRQILEVFFTIHDPTTLNRQGPDVGTQYRSAIFYNSEQQKQIADEVISDFRSRQIWERPIVTEVTPLDEFFPAEDYHQEYFEQNPNQGYCRAVIEPKVAKFRKQYFELLKR